MFSFSPVTTFDESKITVLCEIENTEKFKVFPTYTDKFKADDKFLFQEMSVLQYCDGKNSLRDIVEKTDLKKGEIFEVLERYLDKKKIKYKLEGDPIYCPYLHRNITPKDIKLGIVSRRQLEVSNYCDGKTTVKKILENLASDGLSITYDEFKKTLKKGGMIQTCWCGKRECEDKIKDDTGAKITNIPFKKGKIFCNCISCGKKAKFIANFSRTY